VAGRCGFQLREEDNVANAFLSEQHHAEAIDADAHATGGRHTVFEGDEEVLVEFLLFAAGLVFETFPLFDRVILFAVGWGDFLAIDAAFEDFDGGGVLGGGFGEGDQFFRDVGDEDGVDERGFDEFLEHGLRDFEIGGIGGHFGAESEGATASVGGADVEQIRAGELAEEVFEAGATPWGCEVDSSDDFALGVTVLDGEGAEDGLGDVADHGLEEFHHGFVVTIGLVEFEHGELGVMAAGDAFVAEVAAEFEDAVEASDEQSFKVEFEGDTEEEVTAESVVVSDEGLGGGTTWHGLHHWGFDLDVLALVEELADFVDDGAAFEEDLAHVFVGDEVEVTLAVTDFGIGESVPLFGRGTEGLGERDEFFGFEGDFAHAGGEEGALDAEEVAEVEEFIDLELGVAEGLALEVDLETTGSIAEVEEHAFTHFSAGGDATGDGCMASFGVMAVGVVAGFGGVKPVGEGVDTLGEECAAFVVALPDESVGVVHTHMIEPDR